MRRSGKVAIVVLVPLLQPACHKRALPPPPHVPAATTQPAQPENRRTTPPATPTQPAPPPQPQPAPAQPEFRLGQTLTPEEQHANNVLVDQHLQRATQALASIGNRPLTNEQKSTVAQIRGFMDQARQMRTTDVLRARSLAERADVLTQDLLGRLKVK